MINRLRSKFILISVISVLSVILLVFCVILVLNISLMNRNMDMLADRVSEGGGRFPGGIGNPQKPDKIPPINGKDFEFITPETPFSTRHFSVFFDNDGEVVRTNTESIYSIGEELAIEYARIVLDGERTRGWISNYRYSSFATDHGVAVVFVDGSVNLSSLVQSMTVAGLVLLGCAALVLLLIILLSKPAVKPIAESYEKQKQFITDANHELKTPLTLILANLDIAEGELGKNEWLDDIRAEGNRMTELVNQLVSLSRMDENEGLSEEKSLPFGKIVSETVAEFEPLAIKRGKKLLQSIDTEILLSGDESLLRRLIVILLDNAVKYCDGGGEINVELRKGRKITLTVENTYSAVGELELGKLFDRFYRADKARKFQGGFGIGLSMARSIVEKHKGEIAAYKKDDEHIGFKVIL